MTKNLHDLAIDAGMTEREFIDENDRLYACRVSAAMHANDGIIFVHTAKLSSNVELEIIAKIIPAKNVSLN